MSMFAVGETVFVDLVHVSVCAFASAYTCVQIYNNNMHTLHALCSNDSL